MPEYPSENLKRKPNSNLMRKAPGRPVRLIGLTYGGSSASKLREQPEIVRINTHVSAPMASDNSLEDHLRTLET